MTASLPNTLERPVIPRTKPAAKRVTERSPLGPGLVAAAWAAGAGLVIMGIPVLLVWATDSRSGSGAAAATRAIGQLWLFAHGTSVAVPGGVVGLTPLGLALVPLLLLHRAGRHGARSLTVASVPQALRLVVAVAFPYAVATACIAAASATEDIRPAPVQAMACGLLVGALGAASGILREAGLLSVTRRFPLRTRHLLCGTAAATATLLAAGAALSGLALASHASRATSLAGASDPGLAGGLALLVLGLTLVPNAAIWGAAWLAGPGFAVGVGTAVGPFGTTLGAVPALPLMAALPQAPVPTWVGVLALAVPLAAGALGGVLMVRNRTHVTLRMAATEGLLLGACVGLVMTALAYLSGGPVGGGRLTDVGPSPWQLGLAVSLEVGLAAAAVAAAVRQAR